MDKKVKILKCVDREFVKELEINTYYIGFNDVLMSLKHNGYAVLNKEGNLFTYFQDRFISVEKD